MYLCGMAYTEEQKDKLFEDILKELETGKSLRYCLDKFKISRTLFFKILDSCESKKEQYARAKSIGIEAKFQSIEQDYLEEPQRDPTTGKIDTGWVQLQRLKIDAKKWELSKLAPKKYGDKLELDNKVSGTLETKTTIKFTKGSK